jgi:hypothetical protein
MVSNIIAGFENGKRFLGQSDMFGAKFEADHVLSGMACISIIKVIYVDQYYRITGIQNVMSRQLE